MEKKHYSIDNVFLMADAHNIMDRIQLRNLKEIRSTKKLMFTIRKIMKKEVQEN